jgi:hypothetical protein
MVHVPLRFLIMVLHAPDDFMGKSALEKWPEVWRYRE